LVVGLLAHVAKYAARVALFRAMLNNVARWPSGLPWYPNGTGPRNPWACHCALTFGKTFMATLAKLTGAVPPALALHHARKLLNVTGAPLAKLNAWAALGAVWVALGVALAITGKAALLASVTPLVLVVVLVVAILVTLVFVLG